jgi:hypothetical protein
MANIVTTLPAFGAFPILPSGARTATPDTQEFELPSGAVALHVVLDVTAIVTTPSITVTVAGIDRVSGKAYTLLASAAVTATGTTVLKIGPGLTAAANLVANDYVPSVVRVTVAHGNANSITYSAAANVIGR